MATDGSAIPLQSLRASRLSTWRSSRGNRPAVPGEDRAKRRRSLRTECAGGRKALRVSQGRSKGRCSRTERGRDPVICMMQIRARGRLPKRAMYRAAPRQREEAGIMLSTERGVAARGAGEPVGGHDHSVGCDSREQSAPGSFSVSAARAARSDCVRGPRKAMFEPQDPWGSRLRQPTRSPGGWSASSAAAATRACRRRELHRDERRRCAARPKPRARSSMALLLFILAADAGDSAAKGTRRRTW